jgi:hypothetical protein
LVFGRQLLATENTLVMPSTTPPGLTRADPAILRRNPTIRGVRSISTVMLLPFCPIVSLPCV